MRTLYTLILFLFFSSCSWQAYPDQKLFIDASFRNLISGYKIGDTLVFKTSKNEVDSFKITNIDSTTNNEKGFFINARNSKSLFVSYRQIPVDKWAHSRIGMGPRNSERKEITEDARLLNIERFPDSEKTELNFNFKTFWGCGINNLGPVHVDTLNINGLKFSNYYKIEYCSEDVKDSLDVKAVYSTYDKGIVAYQYKNGMWWTRQN